jgi:Asp-tRNA(Asn)/Glu-tRNA(Gln) amidotransferase A subunit family amidase
MGSFAEYDQHDAIGLAALIAKREVSPLEVLDEAIARAEKYNPTINAITLKLYERARVAAGTVTASGPFAGVPFLLKDLGAMLTGTVSSGSSKLFADAVADHDATIVTRYRSAGLTIFGRSASPELGLATSTEPAMFGPCRNPWNLGHSAGGSSGGAAATVAVGILPMAHATDGGGSIRIPASACGLFGLKPTRARNPSGPDVGEGWGGQSVGHCVSISVRDSAALLDATAGPDIGDPYWAPPQAGPFLNEVTRPPEPLRIALTTSAFNGEAVDPDCRQAAEDAAKLCESLGHHVTQAAPVLEHAPVREAQRIIVAANIRALLAGRAAALGRTLTADDVEPMTWSVAELARQYSAVDYANAITRLHSVGRIVGRFFRDYDILLTPTMCTPPPKIGVVSPSNPDSDAYLTAINRGIGFTSLFNAAGNPAMSVPLHWTASGLPVGVQFVAPFGDEATLFRLAGQLETARPWKHRRPPVTA